MRRFLALLTCLALATLPGCSDRGAKESEGGIEVQWPGGSVKIDPDKGVDVQAPGVGVQVKKGAKVDIDAPAGE
jgi:hypothetical protein